MIISKQTTELTNFICVNPECLGIRMNKIEKKIEDIKKFMFREDVSLQTSLSLEEIDDKK